LWRVFGVALWASVLSIPFSAAIGLVAARATGETNVTPTKPLSSMTMLAYGSQLPGNVGATLMSANVTGTVGLHAADLLTSLKTGAEVGASSRRQLWAQLVGVLVGAAVVVCGYNVLIPTAAVIGSETVPAPTVQVWMGVSKILAMGLSALGPTQRAAVLIGALGGVALVLSERFLPPRFHRFIPSASALGTAMVMPAYSSISIVLGAALAHLMRKVAPEWSKRSIAPIASGLIVGESLVGILIAFSRAGS
jgi:uncharacterized oligopeptide transporter (OPT) family protein